MKAFTDALIPELGDTDGQNPIIREVQILDIDDNQQVNGAG